MKSIFDSGLLTPSSTSYFKVYQETFTGLVEILKAAALLVPPSDPINVDPYKPSVIQLWTKIKGIICNVNQFMKPFFNPFGEQEVSGLSPFAVNMDSPDKLINIIKYLFYPPKRDLRDNTKYENSTNPYDNGDGEQDADANHTCNIIPGFKNNIQPLDLDKETDHESIDSAYSDENHDSFNIDVEKHL